MIDKVVGNKCTGCNMCADICPRKAIYYEKDDEGFSIPKVDYEKCVKCGLCVKKCPALMENIHKKDVPKVYAAWTKDEEIRIQSTSGGIYFVLAQKFIQNGGYIVGSVYDKDFKGAHHIVGNTIEDLKKIMGSKYFQSNAEGIYDKVKALLDNEKKVLFCGTPCQSAALQSFLSKEYDNLFIIDFICRGINSPLAFKRHIEELEENNNSKVKLVQLKNKKTGWQSLATYVEFENGNIYHQDKHTSPWIKGFVGGGGLYMRYSCHECNFRGLPRISDITIGDFWGIHGMSDKEMFEGISSVMINSPKGQMLFDSIKSDIIFEKRNLDELIAGNPAILYSPEKNINRDKFFKTLKDKKFSKAVNECSMNKKNFFYKKIIKKGISFLRKIKFLLKIDTLKFFKYNFFSKNIIREKKVYLIPYKGTIIDIDKNARIYIKGKNLELCVNKLKKSKAEMHLRMEGTAKWYVNNGAQLFYNTVVEVKNSAILNTGFFSANGGTVIICANKINIGEDVMLGRNIIIYDSNFHQIFNDKMQPTGFAEPVNIEDHVWLTSNVTVLKGVTLGRDSIVTAQTVITKDFPENSIIANKSDTKVISKCNGWSRKAIK